MIAVIAKWLSAKGPNHVAGYDAAMQFPPSIPFVDKKIPDVQGLTDADRRQLAALQETVANLLDDVLGHLDDAASDFSNRGRLAAHSLVAPLDVHISAIRFSAMLAHLRAEAAPK